MFNKDLHEITNTKDMWTLLIQKRRRWLGHVLHKKKKSKEQRRVEETSSCPMCHQSLQGLKVNQLTTAHVLHVSKICKQPPSPFSSPPKTSLKLSFTDNIKPIIYMFTNR